MKCWSDKLIKLTKEYLNYDGTHAKSLKGQFGILNIDNENQTYTITLKSTNQELVYNSVDDIIKSG